MSTTPSPEADAFFRHLSSAGDKSALIADFLQTHPGLSFSLLDAIVARMAAEQRRDMAALLPDVFAALGAPDETLITVGGLLAHHGLPEEAAAVAVRLLTRAEQKPEAALLLAAKIAELPLTQARQALAFGLQGYVAANAAQFPPQTAFKLMGLATLHLGQIEAAHGYFQNAAAMSPFDAEVSLHLASLEALRGRADAAHSQLELVRAATYKRLPPAAPARPRTGVVVLVSPRASPREQKMAHGLKAAGWKVIYLVRIRSETDSLYFDDVRYYRNHTEAVAMLKAIAPDISHIFCRMYDFSVAVTALAEGVGPIVVDVYDNLNLMFPESHFAANPSLDVQRPVELYCMENAHGLCCRHLEAQVLRRSGLLTTRRPTIYFPEYSWGNIAKRPKLSQSDGVLRMVYPGSWCEEILIFCQLAAKFGFHFHMYLDYHPDVYGKPFEDAFHDFIKMAEMSPFTHIHKPVYTRDYLSEMSQYDAMLNVIHLRGLYPVRMLDNRIRYGYSNKFGDAIDANLLYMVNKENICTGLGRRFGLSIGFDNDMLMSAPFWDSLLERAQNANFPKAETAWNVARQAERLSLFYNGLIETYSGASSSRA